jgi:hypothetical protein
MKATTYITIEDVDLPLGPDGAAVTGTLHLKVTEADTSFSHAYGVEHTAEVDAELEGFCVATPEAREAADAWCRANWGQVMRAYKKACEQ